MYVSIERTKHSETRIDVSLTRDRAVVSTSMRNLFPQLNKGELIEKDSRIAFVKTRTKNFSNFFKINRLRSIYSLLHASQLTMRIERNSIRRWKSYCPGYCFQFYLSFTLVFMKIICIFYERLRGNMQYTYNSQTP